MRPFTALLVVGHMVALAAYTLPQAWVPARLYYWSQAYARVPFHQDWGLFAPDPPACGCTIELRYGDSTGWVPLKELHDHFIWRRMAAKACRLAETSTTRLPDALEASVLRMARTGNDGPRAVRLVREGADRPSVDLPLGPVPQGDRP